MTGRKRVCRYDSCDGSGVVEVAPYPPRIASYKVACACRLGADGRCSRCGVNLAILRDPATDELVCAECDPSAVP